MGFPTRLHGHGKPIKLPAKKGTRCPSCRKYVTFFSLAVKRKGIVQVCPFCAYEFKKIDMPPLMLQGLVAQWMMSIEKKLERKVEETISRPSIISQMQDELRDEYKVLMTPNAAPELKVSDITIVDMMLEKKANTDAKSYLYFTLAIVAHMFFVIFFKTDINYWLLFLVVLLAGSLFANRQLLRYRIRMGYYGTNEDEAREIIQFILEHAEDTDFTDGDGTKKIMPDPETELREEFVPVGGLTI